MRLPARSSSPTAALMAFRYSPGVRFVVAEREIRRHGNLAFVDDGLQHIFKVLAQAGRGVVYASLIEQGIGRIADLVNRARLQEHGRMSCPFKPLVRPIG